MIYGYDRRTVNEQGLREMQEVTFAMPANQIREVAAFLNSAADKLEGVPSIQAHEHAPEALRDAIGCDIIVMLKKT
ncbi:MAG: hypothetical protein KDA69_01425 [Planctomycetaceae bacterium]|nr:hypothetical protein [Planctomycetaceae bacterium]MCA9042947.1 hypothetical protein [Planctomycetaceae bacterium]MCB9949708.1 hypothetical protein [Planctomycetaceae bacterium]